MTVRPVDDEFMAELSRINMESERLAPLKSGGGDGTSSGMEGRVSKLETHMEYVRRDLDGINGKLDKLIERAAELPSRADLNAWRWQWLVMGITIIALTVGGITGGLSLIARFTG